MKWQELQEKLVLLTKRNILNVELAKALEINKAGMTVKFREQKEVKTHELIKVAQYFGIEINSLLNTNTIANNQTDDNITIPVKGNVTASMGTGVEIYDETQTGTYQLGAKLLKDIGVNRNSCEMIFASGDSMFPTIIGGDSLLVDTSKTEIYDGKIYCVRIDGQLYAKRLQKLPPNKIKVVSDNSEKYDAFYIDFTKDIEFDFCIIGEVKWWGRVAK